MEVRDFDHDDLASLPGIRPAGWNDIVSPFQFYLQVTFAHPICATINGQLAGVGAATSFGPSGWLGHIVVAPGHRRRGIGTVLCDTLLAWLHQAGCRTVSLVATQDGYPLYSTLGFEPQSEYVFFERQPEAAAAFIRRDGGAADGNGTAGGSGPWPLRENDLEQVIAMDREVTGEDREQLLRWGGKGATVWKDPTEVTGYSFPSLGEGFVAAADEEAGRALLRPRLAGATRVVMPCGNDAAVDEIRSAGFTELRRSTRMVRGPEFPWRPECVYSRIGGHLG